MKKLYFLFIASIAISLPSFSTNLQIEQVEFRQLNQTSGEQFVKMTVAWKNAWHNAKNHDAAWVLVKFVHDIDGYRHAKIAKEGHKILRNPNNVKAVIKVPEDQTGFFLQIDEDYRGDVEWTIQVRIDESSLRRVNVRSFQCRAYGLEMVYIPQGSFILGDPDTTANRFGSFYVSDGNGEQASLLEITSEDQSIEIGKEQGKLCYRPDKWGYRGDLSGSIPSEFPKGFQAFYIMKYETQQGEYAQFLNTLSPSQSAHRAISSTRKYQDQRGSIELKGDKYIAQSPQRPCNWVSWEDGLAFADWAALRPMTEFEFTKASRGGGKPKAKEYPWNTSNKDELQRGINMNDELVQFNEALEKDLSESTRPLFGASFYWVMDLAGSLWERVITIGDEVGRAYKGAHGNGGINGNGFANVDDWPRGDDEVKGYGFRGGGYYKHGHNFNDFLPHSPIAYRTFGAWSGGYRTIAYSQRFVRTAEW